jgi:hypothetical protein
VCTVGVFESQCQGAEQHFLAAPANCDDCDTATTGVCCDDWTGACEDGAYEFNCRRIGQRFLPEPATCGDFDPPCGPPWGACCDDDSGMCENGIYESQCQAFGTRFSPATSCDELEPPCGISACCLPDESCVMLDEDACVNPPYDGIWQEPASVCTQPWPCCFGDGSCQEMDPVCCDEMGGTVGYADICLGDGNANSIDDACELPGDIDDDGDVDLGDYAMFAACMRGPGAHWLPGICSFAEFGRADVDDDSDVDLRDFVELQEAIGGS